MCKCPELEGAAVTILVGGDGTRMISTVKKPFMYKLPGITCSGDIANIAIEAGFDWRDIFPHTTATDQAEMFAKTVKEVPSINTLCSDKHFGYVGNVSIAAQDAASSSPKIEYVIIFPGDSHYGLHEACCETLRKMVDVSRKTGRPTVAGVPIGSAEGMQGFGCIAVKANPELGNYEIIEMVEKPKEEVAKKMMREHKVFASSGLYCIPVSCLKDHPKYSRKALEEQLNGIKDDYGNYLKSDIGLEVPEFIKGLGFTVIEMNAEWDDIGTMHSLYNIQKRGAHSKNATLSHQPINSHGHCSGSVRTNCIETFFVVDTDLNVEIYGTNTKKCSVIVCEKNDRLCGTALPFKLDQLAGLVTKKLMGTPLKPYEEEALKLLTENNGCRIISSNMMNADIPPKHMPMIVPFGMKDTAFMFIETREGVEFVVSANDQDDCTVSDEIIAAAKEIIRKGQQAEKLASLSQQ